MATVQERSESRGARGQMGHNGNGRGAPESVPVDWERLSRTYIHWLRISILEVLGIDGGRVLSPTDLSRELRHDLSNVDYHVRQLAKAGLIVLAYRRPGQRGATENFYRLS
ncbi:MAG: helix-turn-helix transcriptional regulator [Actinobacteria bacterium]|nr:helix-turn-helix transcriptional regulator [Actinomycetota bacterium]